MNKIDLRGTLGEDAQGTPILVLENGDVVDFVEMITRSTLMDITNPKQVHILVEKDVV